MSFQIQGRRWGYGLHLNVLLLHLILLILMTKKSLKTKKKKPYVCQDLKSLVITPSTQILLSCVGLINDERVGIKTRQTPHCGLKLEDVCLLCFFFYTHHFSVSLQNSYKNPYTICHGMLLDSLEPKKKTTHGNLRTKTLSLHRFILCIYQTHLQCHTE